MFIKGGLTYLTGATVPKTLVWTLWYPFPQRPGYMSPAALFTFSERAGLLLLVETSAVSASAIIGLLSYIAVCGARDLPRSRLNGQFFSKV